MQLYEQLQSIEKGRKPNETVARSVILLLLRYSPGTATRGIANYHCPSVYEARLGDQIIGNVTLPQRFIDFEPDMSLAKCESAELDRGCWWDGEECAAPLPCGCNIAVCPGKGLECRGFHRDTGRGWLPHVHAIYS